MKANIIIMAMALCLVGAPVAEALTVNNVETLMPSKKKKKKTSTQGKKKTTATTTSQPTTQDNAVQQQATEQPTQNSSSNSSALGNILNGLFGSSSSNQSTSSSSNSGNSVLSALTTIFDAAKGATKNKIVGTWTYTEPAVVFESNNALKNIGGKVASQTIENQLQTQFEKYGIKKGMMTMTFDKDGNFTQTLNGKTVSGTYTLDNSNVTLKYGGKVQQIVGTTQIDGNSLLIVMDASKLLKYANTIGTLTGNSLLKTAGSLLSSMDGMEVGLKLEK